MKYHFAMKYLLLVFSTAAAAGFSFYDDFNDNDISDWESRCAGGNWYAQNGMVHGNTGSTPAVLVPVDQYFIIDGTIVSSCTGDHAFGLAARLTDEDSGVIAYVSPDHDVARIRLVEEGQLGAILTDMNASFPSGADYTLTLTCEGSTVLFEIEVPSSGSFWSLSAADPFPAEGKFGFVMGDEPGATWDWIDVNGSGTFNLDMTWFTTDDNIGNGNMCLEQTETVLLGIELSNPGDESLTGVFAILQSLSSNLAITQNQVTYGNMAGLSSSYGTGSFGVMAPATTPDGVYDLRLTVFADGGYQKQIDFSLPVGCGLVSNFEGGSGGWTHGAVSAGWTDDWHVSTTRNHTASGAQSWKCGSTGSGDYSNHQYAFIQTPYINVPLSESAEFWSWMDAQEQTSSIAYDGGLLQYRRMGEWIDVPVSPDYSHQIAAGTTGPFTEGTPVLGGEHDWTLYQFSVPDMYAGPGMYRFVFGSDDTGNREGWYIDDFSIADLSTAVEDHAAGVPCQYLSVSENPFSDAVTFSYRVAGSQDADLEIYDLSGRTVETLPLSSSDGEGCLTWNSISVPSGVYFARITQGTLEPVRLVKF